MGICWRDVTHGNAMVFERMYADSLRPSNVCTLPILFISLGHPLTLRVHSAGLPARKWINWLAIYTYVGYVITLVCYFTVCHPFPDYWAVPVPVGHGKSAPLLYFVPSTPINFPSRTMCNLLRWTWINELVNIESSCLW